MVISSEQNAFCSISESFSFSQVREVALDFAGKGPRHVLREFVFYVFLCVVFDILCRSHYYVQNTLEGAFSIYFLDFKNYCFNLLVNRKFAYLFYTTYIYMYIYIYR